jgi:hypothetical protein
MADSNPASDLPSPREIELRYYISHQAAGGRARDIGWDPHIGDRPEVHCKYAE